MNKEFNNNNEFNMNVGDVNQSGENNRLEVKNIKNRNKENQIDKTNVDKSKTIINKPKVSELQYKEPETYRPHLKDREGEVVTGFGFIAGKSYYIDGGWVLINLIDVYDKYICDHVHINMKECIYNYSIEEGESTFIKFTGKIEKYVRKNGTKDYQINLIKPVKFINDMMYNSPSDDIYEDYNEDFISKFFENASRRELIDLTIKLKDELNELTSYEFGENFIYYYIINTFMLNRATYDLYEGNLRGLVISNYGLVDMIYVVSCTIFQIKTSHKLALIEILHLITVNCNILQNITNYNLNKDDYESIKFKKYCKSHLKIKDLESAWNIMLNRRRNFGSNPNPYRIEMNDILDYSFHVLNKYIR